jgi:hypothetical protein
MSTFGKDEHLRNRGQTIMREKLNALGVPPEFHAHARHFAGVFRGLGWTPTQIDEAIAWGASFGKPEDRFSQFAHFARRLGQLDALLGGRSFLLGGR